LLLNRSRLRVWQAGSACPPWIGPFREICHWDTASEMVPPLVQRRPLWIWCGRPTFRESQTKPFSGKMSECSSVHVSSLACPISILGTDTSLEEPDPELPIILNPTDSPFRDISGA
jgi:hypothetical protein